MTTNRILLAALALLFIPITTGLALTVLDDDHADLEFEFNGTDWDVEIHHDDLGHFDPWEAVLVAYDEAFPVGARYTRPAGADWDFIGVGSGETFFHIPLNEEPGIIYPGVEIEGPFAAYTESADSRVSGEATWVSLHLRDIVYHGDGIGHFSMWTVDASSNPIVWMSTADGGITAEDRLIIEAGQHAHVAWGFSDLGFYEIMFEASGYIDDGDGLVLVESGWYTFNFGIGTTAIPEPSTYAALFGLITLVVAGIYRRKRR